MPHKADTSVICQCGALINKYYYRTHIQTAKHARDMIGRENIEVAQYVCYIRMNECMYIHTYVIHMYIHITS